MFNLSLWVERVVDVREGRVGWFMDGGGEGRVISVCIVVVKVSVCLLLQIPNSHLQIRK